jgi:hypothetical protein
MKLSDLVAYVDVDDTLVRSFGSKRIPMPAMATHVRELHRAGVVLYCWSSGGAKYAAQSRNYQDALSEIVAGQRLTHWMW